MYISSGYLPQCEGISPVHDIYSHISGIDLVQGKGGEWYILEYNLRIPSGASYPLIARELTRVASPKSFSDNDIVDNRNYAKLHKDTMDYECGIQLASFYQQGNFLHHVKIMETGITDSSLLKLVGMEYGIVRTPRPYDTTTLNYNWQIWETKAFSMYTNATYTVDEKSARVAVEALSAFYTMSG